MAKGHKTGGRRNGSVNKATADIKALAQNYTPRAIAILADLMEHAQSERARVAAATELLDRAHGKPRMAPEDAESIAGLGGILAAAWARKGLARAA